jgi:hypothetical protein
MAIARIYLHEQVPTRDGYRRTLVGGGAVAECAAVDSPAVGFGVGGYGAGVELTRADLAEGMTSRHQDRTGATGERPGCAGARLRAARASIAQLAGLVIPPAVSLIVRRQAAAMVAAAAQLPECQRCRGGGACLQRGYGGLSE